MPSELHSIMIKGDPGYHLQGISLSFTNGVTSPFFEHKSHGAAKEMLPLDLEIFYNRIYVKVANSGNNAVVTGLRIGT